MEEGIVFLHKLVPGGASRSYGIQVARLAGLDKAVIGRARQILDALERGGEIGPHALPAGQQLSLLAQPAPKKRPTENGEDTAEAVPPVAAPPTKSRPSAVEETLAQANLDGMSPREAHAFLVELQRRVTRRT